jgi:hypothetical protein
LFVFTACLSLVPSIDPDVSRRKPATTLRGGYLSVPATRSGGDATMSSFPNNFLDSVRRVTSARAFSGMKWWERIPESTVVNLLEIIVVIVRSWMGLYAVIEMDC